MKMTRKINNVIAAANGLGCFIISEYDHHVRITHKKAGRVGLWVNEDGTAHRTDVCAELAMTIRTEKSMIAALKSGSN